jgi:uncharacterized damage-inducible protein DinB
MQIILLKSIHQILTYNKWANEKIIFNIQKLVDEDYYKKLSIPFDSIHGLLQHLFYYDEKCFNKLGCSSNKLALEDPSRNHLAEIILFISNKWISWVEELFLLDKLPDSFDEISKNIIDLSIHNNYHRGQINVALSLMGYKPESLDVYMFNEIS